MNHCEASRPIAPEELHSLIEAAQAGARALKLLAENGNGERNDSVHVCALLRRCEREGITARNRVIMANMRLVTKIAAPLAKAAGVLHELDDLTQAGVIGARGTGGLMRAIEKFDTKRGKRFSTYATFWIRLAIQDALNEMLGGVLRGGAQKRSAKARRVAEDLAEELGRKPDDREVKARCALLGVEIPSDRTIEHSELGPNALRTDADLLADPEDPIAALEARDVSRRALATLDPRELAALHLLARPGEPYTLEEIATHLDLSKSGARLVVRAALEKAGRAMLVEDGIPCVDPSVIARAALREARG